MKLPKLSLSSLCRGVVGWPVAILAIVAGLSVSTPITAHAMVAAAVAHPAAISAGAAHVLVGGMIINRENMLSLTNGFKTLFNDVYASAVSMWDQVAMTVPSGTRTENYAWLGMSTRFKEWVGERTIQNLRGHQYAITNKRFENTVGVNRDDITDDQFGVYRPMFQMLGYDAKIHPDTLLFPLAKDGDATKCYDGQNFIDDDHPVDDANGVTQSVSNHQAGGGPLWYLLDLSKPVRPFIVQLREKYSFTALDRDTDENVFKRNEFLYGATGRLNVGVSLWQLAFGSRAALTADNYAAARSAMRNFTTDGGIKLNITPTHILAPPSLEGAVNTILKADIIGATTNVWKDSAKPIIVPWLE